MALRIKAAFSRDITGVTQAGIVERAVPAAPLPPFGPCDIIAIFGVGISRFPGRTIDALGGEARVDSHMPSRRGSCQHRTKHCGSADQSEFHHAFLRFVLMRYLDPFSGPEIPRGAFFFGLATRVFHRERDPTHRGRSRRKIPQSFISEFPKFRLRPDPNQSHILRCLAPLEGRIAIVTNAGRDAVDAGSASDEGAGSRTAKSCGPDAPTLASSSRRQLRRRW